MSSILAAAQSSLSHVVKTTVYLQDMADFTKMNEVYAQVEKDYMLMCNF